MLNLDQHTSSLVANYDILRSLLATYGPDEFVSMRDRAILKFSEQGVPTSKDEEFKYLPLRRLTTGEFGPAYGATVTREEFEATPVGKIAAETVVFVNGESSPELNVEYSLPEGVLACSLQDALERNPAVVERWLTKVATLEGRLGSTNDERFVELNNAFLGEGALVYVPKGVALETPIHIAYLSKVDHERFATYPRTLIVIEDGACAKVIESYVGLAGESFTNAVTEVALGADANLEHTRVQLETDEAIHIGNLSVHQERGSVYTSTTANFGSKIGRIDINAWVDGEHTETWLNGAYVGTGEQILDNHTRIDHAQPNCHSFEVYKGILDDNATGVFNGKIFVYLDAQKTDAKQTNQAILLSPTATINTKPQLEIFADDVKCTHGATVGQLREDALFYLRARGIPLKQARAILVYAFAAEVLEKISQKDLREAMERVLYSKLGDGDLEAPVQTD